ncbi:MAG: type II toxin-antitoxin system RelE/ParE family toxin [Nitrospirae bacterium]|nr:MAG: type II toxin-antitoxin system RelE/ParE family toxin [Nitrospirota bacterium]
MAWEVKWTESAANDLDAVAEHIAKDSPNYAASLVCETRDAVRSLAHLADRGRIVPEWEDVNIRELFVGNYRVLYQVTEQIVYVIGFIHGARDLRALWKRERRLPSGS